MALFRFLGKIFEGFMVAIIVFQAILLVIGVVFRYLLNAPITWADEIVRYSLIWTTFAGAALATKDNKHILVDVIDLMLPEWAKRITNWVADAVVIGFMVFLIFYGIKMTDYERGMFGETLSWFSYAYVYVSIPIGAALTIFFTVSKYIANPATRIPHQAGGSDATAS
ncbi:MAG: TRAP transporter small permease [Deltaproteobacteria bacterium]|nr:TRAP transporter small permease [Deltaproteobacteria bacterium]